MESGVLDTLDFYVVVIDNLQSAIKVRYRWMRGRTVIAGFCVWRVVSLCSACRCVCSFSFAACRGCVVCHLPLANLLATPSSPSPLFVVWFVTLWELGSVGCWLLENIIAYWQLAIIIIHVKIEQQYE